MSTYYLTRFAVANSLRPGLWHDGPSRGMITRMSDTVGAGDSLARAVELLAAGSWQQAHEIVQKDTSTLSAWLHGIVHILEGDLDNAQGWYRRAERAFPGAGAAQAEIAAARRAAQERRESPS